MAQTETTDELVVSIFNRIKEAKTIAALQDICKYASIANNIIDSKYPRIRYNISPEEIESLVVSGIINGETFTFSEHFIPATSIEKLLFSLVWKRGDLEKIRSIIQGIKGVDNKTDRVVFYYFGKYLADKSSPIIDQNVIRAFKCYTDGLEYTDLKSLSKKDNDDIEKYVEWLNRIAQNFTNKEDCIYEIDRILFALGKTIKDKSSPTQNL